MYIKKLKQRDAFYLPVIICGLPLGDDNPRRSSASVLDKFFQLRNNHCIQGSAVVGTTTMTRRRNWVRWGKSGNLFARCYLVSSSSSLALLAMCISRELDHIRWLLATSVPPSSSRPPASFSSTYSSQSQNARPFACRHRNSLQSKMADASCLSTRRPVMSFATLLAVNLLVRNARIVPYPNSEISFV